ncbi:MAG: CRISPR-associated endonuclease Cas2 [Candidatus Thermoplasmatota archaeon]
MYDVDVSIVNRLNKFLKCYLNWRQNSVFEGELSVSQLEKIKTGIKEIINDQTDSVHIYKLHSKKSLEVEIIGIEKNPTERIL